MKKTILPIFMCILLVFSMGVAARDPPKNPGDSTSNPNKVEILELTCAYFNHDFNDGRTQPIRSYLFKDWTVSTIPQQACSARVIDEKAQPVYGATVIFKDQNSGYKELGRCTTDLITGKCTAFWNEPNNVNRRVIAEARMSGAQSDTTYNRYRDYQVLHSNKYRIQNLNLFTKDSNNNYIAVTNNNHRFKRGETAYLSFQIQNMHQGNYMGSSYKPAIFLASTPGGQTPPNENRFYPDVEQISPFGTPLNNGHYYKVKIPTSYYDHDHSFLGESRVLIRYQDSNAQGAQNQIRVQIENNKPVMDIPDQEVRVGNTQSVSLSKYVTDVEDRFYNQGLVAEIVSQSGPFTATIYGDQVRIEGNSEGNGQVRVKISDLDAQFIDANQAVEQSFDVKVNPRSSGGTTPPAPTGNAPVITSSAITAANINQLYQYTVIATDADADTLTYSLTTAPAGMTITKLDNNHARIDWTPTTAGNYNVNVRVNDGSNNVDQPFTITVADQNSPEFTSTPTTTATVGRVYQYYATATDQDNDPLTFSLIDAPAGMTIIPTLGIINWVPTSFQVGDHSVIVGVSDGFTTTQQSYTLSVQASSGNTPVFISEPQTVAVINNDYFYNADAVDSDHDLVVYSLFAGPADMSVDRYSGVVRWRPTATGDQIVSILADDFTGNYAIQTYTITVLDTPPIAVVPTANPKAGEIPLKVSFNAEVMANDSYYCQWDFNEDGVTDSFNCADSYTYYDAGTYKASVTVTSLGGFVVSDTITISALNIPETNSRKKFNVARLRTVNEIAKPGEDLNLHLSFDNNGPYDSKNTRVTVVVPELNMVKRLGPFSVDAGDTESRNLVIEIPEDAQLGEYAAQIIITNQDGIKRAKHRYFTVI